MKNDAIKINRQQPKHCQANTKSPMKIHFKKNMKRKNGNKYLYMHNSASMYLRVRAQEKQPEQQQQQIIVCPPLKV